MDSPIATARHKAHQRAKTHRRRTAGRYGDVTVEYEQAFRAKSKRCPLCRIRMTDKPYLRASKELDHIVPLNVGGTHTIGNVRIICRDCNLRRPKDGSDYSGPVTLWAQQPELVMPRRRGPKPCECGAEKRNGRCYECNPSRRRSRREDGQRAAELRALGWKWDEIAEAAGFANTGACYLAAKAHGLPEVVQAWPRRYLQTPRAAAPPHSPPAGGCVDCGDPVMRATSRCDECWLEINDGSAA